MLHLGSRNTKLDYYLPLEGSCIGKVEQLNDLGFLVTQNLTISTDSHCEMIARKATTLVGKIFEFSAQKTQRYSFVLIKHM